MAKNSKDFLAGLTALADDLRKQIDANLDGWDTNPAAIAERRRKVCDPVNGYEYWDRNYFPHYGRAEPSELHKYLYKRLPEIVNTAAGQRDAIAAPRGEAKSTKISMSFVSWCLVTGAKWYAIIVMDAFEQAAEMLEAIKAELEANPRIANDFPEACGQGRVWRAGVIVTANGRKVEAFGSSKKIRGRRHGAHRPDLAICDDIENDENVNTPAQRDKLQAFVTKSVLSLGPPDDSMDAILVGTVLHYDSVLARFLKNPLWNRKVFKAIIQWPERMDLWEQFEGFLLNADTPQEGEAAAMALYREHQAEMEKGSKVSWPALRPLVKLMIRRAREGHSAFDSEQQNDPTAGEDAPFANSIRFWVNRLAEWVFYGACDPSLGRAGNSRDPSAIGVGGYNRETGIMDVVEAAIRKRVTEAAVGELIKAEGDYIARMTESGTVRVPAFGNGSINVEDRSVSIREMLTAFFDPTHKEHRNVQSLRECYIEITGDRRVTGQIRDCDLGRMAESLGVMRESVTSSTWSDALGDSITRRMQAVYTGLTNLDAWRRVATTAPIKDFRTQERIRIGGYGNLPAVAQGAPYQPLGSPGDDKATFAVSKRGGTEDVTLEAIKNDDVQALRPIPTELALAAKNTLYEFVFDFFRVNGLIYDSKALYHADHNNLFTGALTASEFAAHRLAMLKQTRAGSAKRLATGPAAILVPFELQETAYDLFVRNQNLDKTFVQTINPEVIPVSYWTDGNDWCTVADPVVLPVLEVGFLDGQEEPELFVQDQPNGGSMFSNDKLTYKIRHIYGGTVLVDGEKGTTKAVVA